ncbi:MAG: hypothetical protein WC514_01700, partial [Candidatus Paceibacterota bacterium]
KTYSFYVGILGAIVIILIPFGFFFPPLSQIFLAFSAGALFVLALYLYYSLVKEFEVSRIAPAIGGLVPIISLLLIFLFSQGQEVVSLKNIVSFSLLIFGSVLIVIEKSKNIFGKSLIFSLGAAFYFALYFVLAKFVYTHLGFINGFIWIRIGGFLMALFFLFSKEVRSQIFIKPKPSGLKTTAIFLGNQIVGGLGSFLQNWAIALTPLVFVAFINALQGLQYVFLLFFTVLFSFKLPSILKEEFSRKIIIQKIVAILLIGGGLFLLVI